MVCNPKAWQVRGKGGRCKLSAEAKKMSISARKSRWSSYKPNCKKGSNRNPKTGYCQSKSVRKKSMARRASSRRKKASSRRKKKTPRRKESKRGRSARRAYTGCPSGKVPYKKRNGRGFNCRKCPSGYYITDNGCRKTGRGFFPQSQGFYEVNEVNNDVGIIKTVTDAIGLTTPPPTPPINPMGSSPFADRLRSARKRLTPPNQTFYSGPTIRNAQSSFLKNVPGGF